MSRQNETVAVIGAGIVGVCSALYLQREGFNVELIDAKGIGEGCSKGNAGHFATEQVFPLADKGLLWQLPSMLLDPTGPFRIRLSYLFKALPWFTRFLFNMRSQKFENHKQALMALNEQALDAYQPLLKAAGLQHLVCQKGSLLTFESGDESLWQAQWYHYHNNGIRVDLLNRKQTLALEPQLSEKVKAALYFKDVAHTHDPEVLCKSLGEYFLSQGGRLKTESVRLVQTRDKTDSNSDIKLSFDKGHGYYDKVVIAAGAWSKRLLTPLKYKVPLDTERGYHLMMPLPNMDDNPITRPVASYDRKFIMTPMQKGLRLAGTVEFAGLNAKMNNKRADILEPHAKKLLQKIPDVGTKDEHRWMGFRPSLPDSLPVIGQAPKHQNLYFAFGHQHLGLTQAAITGQILAQSIATGNSDIDLKPYCISRF